MNMETRSFSSNTSKEYSTLFSSTIGKTETFKDILANVDGGTES